MAKQEKTLFEKLQSKEELEEQNAPKGLRYSMPLKIFIMAVSILLCAVFFPVQIRQHGALKVGSGWTEETLIAQYPFPIYKLTLKYQKEVEDAKNSTLPIFTENSTASDRAKKITLLLLTPIAEKKNVNVDSVEAMIGLPKEILIRLKNIPLAKRKSMARKIASVILAVQKEVYSGNFIDVSKNLLKTKEIAVRTSISAETIIPIYPLLDSSLCRMRAEEIFKYNFDELEGEFALEILKRSLTPNLIFSEELTENARTLAAQAVPRSLGLVRAEELIVSKGERITEQILLKIESYENTRAMRSDSIHPIYTLFGNILHATLIYSMFIVYLYFIRRRLFSDNLFIIGLGLPLVLIAALSWLSVVINTALPIQYGIFLSAFAMLIAILFDSRTAFNVVVTMSLIVAGVRGNDYETAFSLMIAGTFAAFSVRDLQSRTQLFKSMGFIFLGGGLTIIALAFEHSESVSNVGIQLGFSAANAIVSPLITLGLLFILERLFNIATDLRLLEFDNPNHPLLAQLAEKAPGTYQHTLSVTQLAESAARAIEANPILTKVGAYFHDIGKMSKSEYFVENQINIGNKHDRLTPTKSAIIIKNHVEDGIELGREYKLPKRILDFIPMHHGTMIMRYFYVKALEEAKINGTEINADDYRYPGPKPNTKEATIVMLADSIEALSRSLSTSNREEIEEAIDQIVKERLLDGQLDESTITMSDLTKIKESFAKNLIGMSHHRIKYKEIPKIEVENQEKAV